MLDTLSSIGTFFIGIIGVFALGRAIFGEMIPTIRSGWIEARVAKTGIAVSADIVAAHQTSSWGGNKPIFRITVHFKTHEGQHIEAAIEQALSMHEIERYKPGNGIGIKYDPKKPKNIAIYDKPIILGL